LDIRDLARRHHAPAAARSEPAAAPSDVSSPESPAGAASSSGEAGATTHHVSGGGRFLRFLQGFEDRHPEEAKRILNGIADKLRADAEHAGPWAGRLERWADRVEKAADTGDMSNLLPTWQPGAHYGVRAYQKAQAAPEADGGALEHVASSLPPAACATSAAVSSDVPNAAVSSEPAAADAVSAARGAAAHSSDAVAAAAVNGEGVDDAAPSATIPIISGTPTATSSGVSA